MYINFIWFPDILHEYINILNKYIFPSIYFNISSKIIMNNEFLSIEIHKSLQYLQYLYYAKFILIRLIIITNFETFIIKTFLL